MFSLDTINFLILYSNYSYFLPIIQVFDHLDDYNVIGGKILIGIKLNDLLVRFRLAHRTEDNKQD